MNIKNLIFALIIASSIFAAQPAFAQQSNLQYAPLEPIAKFTDQGTADLPSLIKGLFTVLFSLIALWAVGWIVAGGIMYMTSEVVKDHLKAKDMIWAAVYALLILAGSYLILNTINPELLIFKLQNTPTTNSAASDTIPTQFPPQPHNTGVVTIGSTVRIENNSTIKTNDVGTFTTKCEAVGGHVSPLTSSANGTYALLTCKKDRL